MAKKRSSKLLSWLLTLAMVLSLAAGMSITAFAQDNDIIVLYTNDVHCGVDGNSGSADRHVVRGRLSGRHHESGRL